ncbi:DEAD/DEAH box helicase [Nitrospira sp. BLG_2]|uniref:DEAD/DEAH box helicase n=1 Tax=Nitrospira sp. BLG_2 TaxID=3397507 RepID=UPI003B9B6F66
MDTSVHGSFHALGLSEALLQDLADAGFVSPTPIQERAIPPALAGRDVIGCAQTGTGKTAAFVIPIIERLALLPKGQPQALILAPTRELALQTLATIEKFGRSRRISATVIVGGADMQAQVRGLRQRPDVLVATPGRLLDHMWNGTILLSSMKMLVLDEADRMLDMGFAPQINQILDALPEQRQTLLFSATLPADLARLVQASVNNPVRVMVAPSATTTDGVTQAVHYTSHAGKPDLLLTLLGADQATALVFTRTKHRADRLGRLLGRAGHRAAVLHGDRSLSQRRAALEGFRRGAFRVLVATDIAARGIDVANIGHVINFDLPNCPEDYVHRIGRTARMKTTGRATSFVTGEDQHQLRDIERLLGHAVPLAPGSEAPFPPITAPDGGVRRDGHRSRSHVKRSQTHSFRNTRKPNVGPSSYGVATSTRT